MAENTKQPPLSSQLISSIEKGRALIVNPNLTLGNAFRWSIPVRRILYQIYGNTPEIDFWCPNPRNYPKTSTPQMFINNCLDKLESLALFFNTPNLSTNIFIGHGRSRVWLELNHYLSHTLKLQSDEFNIMPTAGIHTNTRILSMLTSARMAFLVMTAEDQHKDGSFHARENVIHEIGLFQAKLGSNRAIILFEDGCSRFSNIDGLTTINFPPNDIMSRAEPIRQALIREGLIT